MAKIKYENWSSEIFPGFYESYISPDSALEFEQALTPKGFWMDVMDYKQYLNEVCIEWVSRMEFEENPIGMKVGRFLHLDSPREYNFRTDRITFEVDVNLHKLKRHCFQEVCERFDKYLLDNWPSCSGFVSFVPNTLESFMDKYESEPQERGELVEVMVEFYLLEYVDFIEVEQAVYERCYDIACQVGIVLTNGTSSFDTMFDDDADMYIAGEMIT